MRVGVIGLGRMGRFHAAALRDHPAVSEVVVAARHADRARLTAADLGVSAAPDVTALLAGVDAVAIAAATDAHADLIGAAAAAGLPTFCEKPVAIDLASTDEVIAVVAESGVELQVGFHRRFDAGYRAARDLVRSGGLGRPYVLRTASHDPAPPPPGYIATSGGIFRDFMVHDFDAVRWVTGLGVDEVFADGDVLIAEGREAFTEHGDLDSAVVVMRLDDGALAVATASRHDPVGYDVRMELFGAGDSVMVGWDDRMPLRSVEPGSPAAPGPPYRDFIDRFAPAYRAELDAFVALARGMAPNPCPPDEARHALAVAVACERSLAEHRPVPVKEVG